MKKFLLFICFMCVLPTWASSLEDDYKELLPDIEFLNIQTGANLKILEPYIEKGNAVAMYMAAQMYENGELISKDETKAFELYLKSADKNPASQFAIANMYVAGKGCEQSLEKAIEYYQKAAVNGDESLKISAERKIAELENIQKKEAILKEMEIKALSADPQAMIGMAEFCVLQENFICSYVWLSLARQMPAFANAYSDLDKSLSKLMGFMTMSQLTQAEEEISTLQKFLPKE